MKTAGISYKLLRSTARGVYLGGRKIGEIRNFYGTFQYFPKGSKTGGEVFVTLEDCKDSLETDGWPEPHRAANPITKGK